MKTGCQMEAEEFTVEVTPVTFYKWVCPNCRTENKTESQFLSSEVICVECESDYRIKIL